MLLALCWQTIGEVAHTSPKTPQSIL
jgi:hypothetical protein